MRLRAIQTLFRASSLLCKCFPAKNNCALTYSQLRNTRRYSAKTGHEFDEKNESRKADNLSSKLRYKVFEDKDADVILDVYEEEQISLKELEAEQEIFDPFEGLNLQRGVRGVYDIEDLVSVLRKEKAKDIFVAVVPEQYSYVDHMVLVTGKSAKHLTGLAEFVMKVFKRKRSPSDPIPRVEGTDDWVAIDLGNIALHIFQRDIRRKYDLETLWSVGPEYDDESQKVCTANIMEQYNAFLTTFEPGTDDTQEQKQE